MEDNFYCEVCHRFYESSGHPRIYGCPERHELHEIIRCLKCNKVLGFYKTEQNCCTQPDIICAECVQAGEVISDWVSPSPVFRVIETGSYTGSKG